MEAITHKPCPFCGSTDLHYNCSIQHGQGDCTFEGWIECNGCGYRNGYVGNWGTSSHKDEHDSWNKWDGTNRPFVPEEYETEKETEERKFFERLSAKYDGMSLMEFIHEVGLNRFKTDAGTNND